MLSLITLPIDEVRWAACWTDGLAGNGCGGGTSCCDDTKAGGRLVRGPRARCRAAHAAAESLSTHAGIGPPFALKRSDVVCVYCGHVQYYRLAGGGGASSRFRHSDKKVGNRQQTPKQCNIISRPIIYYILISIIGFPRAQRIRQRNLFWSDFIAAATRCVTLSMLY